MNGLIKKQFNLLDRIGPSRAATLRRVMLGVALSATLAVNAAANALPINGQTTGEIADRFQVYFTPAGYVFSIWGLIYAGLIALLIYAWTPRGRRDERVDAIAAPLLVNLAANCTWIVLWHHGQFALSVAVIVVMLATLALAYQRLAAHRSLPTPGSRWLLDAPVRLYAGWVSVATVANLTVWLEASGLRPWDVGAEPWAAAMIGLAAALGTAVSWRRADAIYGGVFVWAFVGMAVANGTGSYVTWVAVAAAALVAATVVASRLRRPRGWQQLRGRNPRARLVLTEGHPR